MIKLLDEVAADLKFKSSFDAVDGGFRLSYWLHSFAILASLFLVFISPAAALVVPISGWGAFSALMIAAWVTEERLNNLSYGEVILRTALHSLWFPWLLVTGQFKFVLITESP